MLNRVLPSLTSGRRGVLSSDVVQTLEGIVQQSSGGEGRGGGSVGGWGRGVGGQ